MSIFRTSSIGCPTFYGIWPSLDGCAKSNVRSQYKNLNELDNFFLYLPDAFLFPLFPLLFLMCMNTS